MIHNVHVHILRSWLSELLRAAPKACKMADVLTCQICTLELMDEDADVHGLPCGHLYHQECLAAHASVQKCTIHDLRCPVCKLAPREVLAKSPAEIPRRYASKGAPREKNKPAVPKAKHATAKAKANATSAFSASTEQVVVNVEETQLEADETVPMAISPRTGCTPNPRKGYTTPNGSSD